MQHIGFLNVKVKVKNMAKIGKKTQEMCAVVSKITKKTYIMLQHHSYPQGEIVSTALLYLRRRKYTGLYWIIYGYIRSYLAYLC